MASVRTVSRDSRRSTSTARAMVMTRTRVTIMNPVGTRAKSRAELINIFDTVYFCFSLHTRMCNMLYEPSY